MKILEKVKEIIVKHNSKPIELPNGYRDVYAYLRNNPHEKNKFESEKDDEVLCEKYKDRIPRGWYGFDIGTPIVPDWIEILDEIVELCIKADPDFEIHQIKLKYGGIRFYVGSMVIDDICDVEDLIENTLYDQALIY